MVIAFLSALLVAAQPVPAPAPPAASAPSAVQRPPVRVEEVRAVNSANLPRFSALGSCRTRGGRDIDMHRVLFLDDRPVEFDAPGGPFRAYVREQTLLIDAITPNGDIRDTWFNRMDYQLSADGGGDLDLQIQLASAEGRLAVFWRETYRNRIYRQGLYSITGQGVAPLCSGMGGIRTED